MPATASIASRLLLIYWFRMLRRPVASLLWLHTERVEAQVSWRVLRLERTDLLIRADPTRARTENLREEDGGEEHGASHLARHTYKSSSAKVHAGMCPHSSRAFGETSETNA